jgi:hypothetical protein
MPYIETVDELADNLADLLGIYEDRTRRGIEHGGDGCDCRVYWVPAMAARIRRAVENERTLEARQ